MLGPGVTVKDGKVAISPAQLAALTGTRPSPSNVWETNARSTSAVKTSKSKQVRSITIGKILTKREIKAKELAAAKERQQEEFGKVKEVCSFSVFRFVWCSVAL